MAFNKVVLMGRLTKDPSVSYTQDQMAIARFTLALDRVKEGADFPNCIAFGKTAENVEKYVGKGTQILVEGHLQTGSYTNREGVKVYTNDVVADRVMFTERKTESQQQETKDDFLKIPDGLDEELPFM